MFDALWRRYIKREVPMAGDIYRLRAPDFYDVIVSGISKNKKWVYYKIGNSDNQLPLFSFLFCYSKVTSDDLIESRS